jgi:hypothetical protein
MELLLGTCYVRVGGYHTVELRAIGAETCPGTGVRLGMPMGTTEPREGECVLAPTDTIVICGRAGEIARIAVARIVAEGAYAGFRVLPSDRDPDGGASNGAAAVRALEHFLAGVSARALTEKERQERAAE